MVKKTDPFNIPPVADAAQKVKESAQQIWLAGLGAFAKAQQEGGKVFESLVEDGLNLQKKTQAAAQAQMNEATQKFSAVAGGLSSRAGQSWDRLEGIFEERVAKALQRLDVASQSDLAALIARVDALEAQLQPSAPATRRRAPSAKVATAAKTRAKPATPRRPKA